jgi:hypothetical protein
MVHFPDGAPSGEKTAANGAAPHFGIRRYFWGRQSAFISPTHKRTEGRAPVWGSEFTSKRRRTTGGDPAETAARLNVKLRLLTD